jgi:flagellar capping protein FliD
MGTLNFPGLATGIDTSTVIKQLMTAYSKRLANYQVKQATLEAKSTSFDDLKTKASQFQSAAAALADSSKLQVFKTTTSDSNRLGISATTEANPGSHSVIINQLATSESWIQDNSTFDYETDYVGAGNFIYSYNYQERVIATTATTTLEDLVGQINNDEKNPGVTASLLYQGGKYHLMLNGQETGKDYQISINSTTTEVWKPDTSKPNSTLTQDSEDATLDTQITDLDQWSGPHTGAETITISGKDHSGKAILPARTLAISDDTTLNHLIKEINTYYEGVATATLENGQIVLTDHTSGASGLQISLAFNANGSSATLGLPTLAVATEGGSTAATVSSLTPSKFVQTQDAQNAQVKIDNYSPTKVAEVQTLTPRKAEVQTLTPDAAATGGTFTLSFGGQTTAALAYNASIADIQTALNALSTVAVAGGVTVAGNALDASGPMTVTFAASAGDVGMVSIDTGSLTGPTAVTVQETTPGANTPATGGTFTLSFGGQTTGALANNASISDIQTALSGLSSVTAVGGVTVAGSTLNAGGPMTFTFAASAGDVGMVSINAGSLTGPDAVTVAETTRGSDEEWISRNSNVITDAVTGITLILQDVNDVDNNGDPIPIQVTVSRNSQAIKDKVDKIVSTYNTLLSDLKAKTEYDDSTKKMGELSNDLAVSLIKTQMKEPFVGIVSGFSSKDSYTQADDIGLSFDGEGNLKLDADTFNNAMKDDYQGVIDLLGASGTGNTDSTVVSFYNASSRYTTAGEYQVETTVAEVDGEKVITSAKIRELGATDWRDMTIQDNLIIGNSAFDSTGIKPLYAENGLYLQVDLSNAGTFTSTVRVKKGLAGTLDSVLADVTKSGGRLDVSKQTLQDQIDRMGNIVKNEQARLDKIQKNLEAKFARLEKTLTEWQQQMSAVSAALNYSGK